VSCFYYFIFIKLNLKYKVSGVTKKQSFRQKKKNGQQPNTDPENKTGNVFRRPFFAIPSTARRR
jgi:hypothetical protein